VPAQTFHKVVPRVALPYIYIEIVLYYIILETPHSRAR
jgi:hypothetical protein